MLHLVNAADLDVLERPSLQYAKSYVERAEKYLCSSTLPSLSKRIERTVMEHFARRLVRLERLRLGEVIARKTHDEYVFVRGDPIAKMDRLGMIAFTCSMLGPPGCSMGSASCPPCTPTCVPTIGAGGGTVNCGCH